MEAGCRSVSTRGTAGDVVAPLDGAPLAATPGSDGEAAGNASDDDPGASAIRGSVASDPASSCTGGMIGAAICEAALAQIGRPAAAIGAAAGMRAISGALPGAPEGPAGAGIGPADPDFVPLGAISASAWTGPACRTTGLAMSVMRPQVRAGFIPERPTGWISPAGGATLTGCATVTVCATGAGRAWLSGTPN